MSRLSLAARRCALAALAALASAGCNDATHDEQVAALGGEDPNVPQGPLHRPGQPCLVCHGGIGPASAQFSAGGTVYTARTSQTPAVGAAIQIEDITGSVGTTTANAAGNFYIPVGQWQPTYPTQPLISLGGMTQIMSTHVGREGSCGACHSDPASPVSAGHIYLTY
jgi:hypothetical protein